jgi:release factor glutamine methyltransferase
MCSSVKVFSGNQTMRVWKDVYTPAEDTFLLADNLSVRRSDHVLDVGTGCGLLAMLAAHRAVDVVATDVNPNAVRCAKENAEMNGVRDKISFVQGDLMAPIRIGATFDLILFNAPYLPSSNKEDASWLGRAWAGGTNGRQVIDRFISESPRFLSPTGRILMIQSTLSGSEETISQFKNQGLKADIVAQNDLPLFETIILFKAEWST